MWTRWPCISSPASSRCSTPSIGHTIPSSSTGHTCKTRQESEEKFKFLISPYQTIPRQNTTHIKYSGKKSLKPQLVRLTIHSLFIVISAKINPVFKEHGRNHFPFNGLYLYIPSFKRALYFYHNFHFKYFEYIIFRCD